MISKSGLKDPEAGAQVEVKDSDDDEKMKEKEKAGSSWKFERSSEEGQKHVQREEGG